jgi:hypothetical protein
MPSALRRRSIPASRWAYWGEALSFSQPLWFHEEADKARAALAMLGPTSAARLAKASTPREKGFLTAVEALWGAGDTSARADAYAGAMARLAAEFPADDEAQTLYALALLGTPPLSDAALPLRQRARQLLKPFSNAIPTTLGPHTTSSTPTTMGRGRRAA